MRLHELLKTPRGEPRLFVPALIALVLTFVVGWVAMRAVQQTLPDEQRAASLARTSRFAAAEEIYVHLLRERPTVKLAIAMLDNHEQARARKRLRDGNSGGLNGAAADRDEVVMTDETLDDLLEFQLPPDISLVARFWRATDKEAVPSGLREAIVVGAEQDPPLPWHNHALGREARRHHELDDAAKRYEREGLAFPERAEDIDHAVLLWIGAGAWDHVRERMQDARVATAAAPITKYQLAVHDRDWKAAARWLAMAWRPHLTASSLVMTGVAALAWGFFCARLGKLGERVRRRLPLYVFAFALGVLSVIPTACLIAVEEATLRLVETGDPMRDILFFVFGVGLREEASKLLLFLPLLPILRKWGDRLDVLVCGALVGLGFAAEENIDYLARGDLHTGLGRFLTANFLHMAMTAILAAALDDFVRDREKYAVEFSRTSLMVVGMHGAYDFLLSHEEYGGSYFAMAVFFVLVRMFLSAVDHARRKADRGLALTQAFTISLAVVTGTSAVYAVATVGAVQGALVMTEGLLGVAILVYAFVRTLRSI
jgi:RsiW-degrading membrane proteinase PrsW (M82 family)